MDITEEATEIAYSKNRLDCREESNWKRQHPFPAYPSRKVTHG